MIGEQIIGMIPKTEIRPGVTDYNLFITNMRIIGGKVGASGLAGIAGGSIGYAISRVTIDKNKYANMNPDEILYADKKNFAWDINYDIVSLEVKKGLTASKIKVQLSPTLGNKKKNIFFSNQYFDWVNDVLRKTAGHKLINNQYPGYNQFNNQQYQQPYVQQPYQQPYPQQAQQPMQQQTQQQPVQEKTKNQSERPKFCTGCGTKIEPDNRFCIKCGKKI